MARRKRCVVKRKRKEEEKRRKREEREKKLRTKSQKKKIKKKSKRKKRSRCESFSSAQSSFFGSVRNMLFREKHTVSTFVFIHDFFDEQIM